MRGGESVGGMGDVREWEAVSVGKEEDGTEEWSGGEERFKVVVC
jgi:hypothetical protein